MRALLFERLEFKILLKRERKNYRILTGFPKGADLNRSSVTVNQTGGPGYQSLEKEKHYAEKIHSFIIQVFTKGVLSARPLAGGQQAHQLWIRRLAAPSPAGPTSRQDAPRSACQAPGAAPALTPPVPPGRASPGPVSGAIRASTWRNAPIRLATHGEGGPTRAPGYPAPGPQGAADVLGSGTPAPTRARATGKIRGLQRARGADSPPRVF